MRPKRRSLRIGSFPFQSARAKAEPTLAIGDAEQAVLAPAIGAAAGVIVGEIIPHRAVAASNLRARWPTAARRDRVPSVSSSSPARHPLPGAGPQQSWLLLHQFPAFFICGLAQSGRASVTTIKLGSARGTDVPFARAPFRVGRLLPPHPNPLPWGEGAPEHGSRKSQRFPIRRPPGEDSPSPRGRGLG